MAYYEPPEKTNKLISGISLEPLLAKDATENPREGNACLIAFIHASGMHGSGLTEILAPAPFPQVKKALYSFSMSIEEGFEGSSLGFSLATLSE